MIIDFESRRTILVATPVDGRCGLSSLTQIAESILGTKVTEGADCVVFILKTVESTLSQIRRRRARGTSGLWPSSP